MQPESVEVDRPEPGVVLLRAKGDLDAYTAPGLRTQLHEATTGDADLVALSDDLYVRDVWAKGVRHVDNGVALITGMYENEEILS